MVLRRIRPIGACLAPVFLGLLCIGCVSGNYRRETRLSRPEGVRLTDLEPGVAELGECLERLGAPLHVWEVGTGAALAWAWLEESGWGVGFSAPLADNLNASADFQDDTSAIPAWVLLFDENWVLESTQRGNLRALQGRFGRKRPNAISNLR